MQISPKKSAFIVGAVFVFGILFFIPTAPEIWHDFRIPKLISEPFVTIVSLFLFAIFLRITLEKHGLSEFCFIPDGLIVVSLIGMLVEVPHIERFFKEGVTSTIEAEFNKHDSELKDMTAKLDAKTKENVKLIAENGKIPQLEEKLKELDVSKQSVDKELIKAKNLIKTDYLKTWEIETSERLKECGKCQKDQPETCLCQKNVIIETINTAPSPNIDSVPTFDGKSNFDKLLRFNRMGYVYLAYAGDLLYMDLGIDRSTFIGTGITVPRLSVSITGVPEYWSFNKTENEKNVITCKITNPSTKDTDTTVRDLLNLNDTLKCKNIDQLEQAIKKLKDRDLPSLFRCHKFPLNRYSGKVGREEAKRVFFSRLDDVIDFSISDACTKTGRILNPNPKEEETLFLWILIPSDPQEVIPATWEQLFKNFDSFENPS